jgi:hypothetical protein
MSFEYRCGPFKFSACRREERVTKKGGAVDVEDGGSGANVGYADFVLEHRGRHDIDRSL